MVSFLESSVKDEHLWKVKLGYCWKYNYTIAQ
jgi:hypothetical protein